MGIFIFFFLLVLFHGYIKSSSSLGFAKSKNGQIEYASTFLEAKHSRSKLVSHYSISRIRRKIKGLSEANAAAIRVPAWQQHSSSGLSVEHRRLARAPLSCKGKRSSSCTVRFRLTV